MTNKRCHVKKALSIWTIVLFVCSHVSVEGTVIGDFQNQALWSGFEVSEERTPHDERTAKLTVPGQAALTFTEPVSYLSGEEPDFADMLDEIAVQDMYDYRYIAFQVWLPDERAVQLELTLDPLLIGRPDYVASLTSQMVVKGRGWQKVLFSLRDFDYPRHQAHFWRYIKRVALSSSYLDGEDSGEILIGQMRLKKGKVLSLTSPVKSKPAAPGKSVEYSIRVENESAEERQVTVVLESTAWEACPASLSEKHLSLGPWESKEISLSVEMNTLVAPGGRERRQVTVVPDGRADLKEEIEFITVRSMDHPYLMHTEAGWQAVIQKAETVDWARESRQEYVDRAHEWRVPKIRTQGDYCYGRRGTRGLLECAIAWKLSGEDVLAEKVIQFLRDFTNPNTGYPTTLRCNNGTKVHRGAFFVQVVKAYDLVYDHPSLTDQDHANIHHTLRLFNQLVDSKLLTGDGNNHLVSLTAGALLNSLVMQDFSEVDRYLYGAGGYQDLLGAGVLDDGHYFEGTANYNLLTANIFNAVAVAFEPWGIDVKNWKVEPKYGKYLMVSDWSMRGDFLGMSFEREGPSTRNYRQLKDIWDAILAMSDYRGVLFPTSDSVGVDLVGGRRASRFELAYYLWRDPAYVPLLKMAERRDLIYGVEDLPDVPADLGVDSYYSDNVGFAVLRSKASGKDARDRYQVVQRYGTHGGYHGHFDRTSLAALSRFGRTHYGPEASWYGYWSFMFKMWVQASDSHNMVTVDHRMQKPGNSERILFHAGDLMQVSATEIETAWIDPPYGGQTPYAMSMPEEKTWAEGRWLPTPENPRPQGDTGTPSEPILQRRLIVVADDYVVMSDYLKGNVDHDFDNLFNSKGLVDLTADELKLVEHTSQADTNPYSSAQFITACDWYDTKGTTKASFLLDWARGDMGGRSSRSEPGKMDIDYYSLWPRETNVMTANYPESQSVARHLFYKVVGDGKVLAEGQFAPWILGSAEIDVDVEGVEILEIETRVEQARDAKTIFLGNPVLVTFDGDTRPLDRASIQTRNVAASEENKDYAGGKVTIFGDDYPMSLPAEPEDRDETGTISVDLIGQGVSRFRATLGGDYPVGGDDIHRKIIATRATGSEARFLSAIELHEDDPVIKRITAESATRIVVERHDGQTDTLEITGLDGDGSAAVRMSVEKAGKVVATENTGQ
jgi:hypothetical protein